MTHDHGNHVRTDKQMGKQQVVEYDSPPLIPKRSITKVQANKASTDGVSSKKEKWSSNTGLSSLDKLCGNVAHLLPADSLQKYNDNFVYKLVDSEYYVNSYAENELKTKFLKPFDDKNILTFISLNRKYNPDYVKAFQCNLESTTSGLQSRFKDRIMKLSYSNFINYFGMRK